MVNKVRMKETFCELVSIYAASKKEREVCDYLKCKLKDLGASIIVEDSAGEKTGGNSGNLIAIFPETQEGLPSIAITGHMDCVEKCKNIKPILKDGVFRSDGTTVLGSDDKVGVTAILEGLYQMKEKKTPHGKLTVIFTIQEEIGLMGSRYFDATLAGDVDYGYTFDGDGEAGTVYNAGPSQYTMEYTITGRAAHAGMEPEKGINAIQIAGIAIANSPTGKIDDETTCNIGTIEGGLATNIVPETCIVHCEARSRNNEKLEKTVEKIDNAFKNATAKYKDAKLTIKKNKEYEAFNIKEDHEAMKLFAKACKNGGYKLDIRQSNGGSDSNLFVTHGFETLLVGVGMTDFHTNKESLKEKDLYEAGDLVWQILNAQTE